MKTKEELLALKEEFTTIQEKLRQLTEEELKLVCGGEGGEGNEEFQSFRVHITMGMFAGEYGTAISSCGTVDGIEYFIIELDHPEKNGGRTIQVGNDFFEKA